MEEEAVKTQINIDANPNDRKGVFANSFMISSGERVVILDCFLIDVSGENENGLFRNGVLASRVLMDRESVVSLRDMLTDHIEKNGWVSDNV